ncbi:ABC transporter substrate-binding protein [Rhodobacter sp. NTK016B]|uniref:ABC transporter substrate-binding protein n=1 Tax=Rhodobacter sp. NTK016B TaxID=2759676 RepID=UPI001A8CBCBC|nr:ABC transporter substrate-binding protein [Rhodobacter sp. NTK016B]MBN8291116.1 ABC transporter substrate-binding protein [Rhodobacter sp. NTK016B]
MQRIIAAALAATLFASPVIAQNTDVSGPLVLYTSQPNEDAQRTVDAFTAAYPNVEVTWIRDGTTQVMARLEAEYAAGAPQADVLLIADMVTMEGLEAQDRLMAYPGADISAYDPALMDPEYHYFSTKLITTGIIYNTNAPFVPESWTDLLRPEAQGQIAMPSPLTSGAATIHMVSLTSNPDLGWDYYQGLADQGTNPQGGNGGVYRAVAGGEQMYGMVVDFLPIREIPNGAPVGFVFPTEGVSAVTEPVAILSSAQNVPAAQAFVDFLISEAGQQLAADMGYLPALPGITPPEGFPALEDIRMLDFDPAAALESATDDRMRFVEIFGG